MKFTNRFFAQALVPALALAMFGAAMAPMARGGDITANDITCTYGAQYDINWDGHAGKLILDAPSVYGNVGRLTYLGSVFSVRYEILLDPQQYVDGSTGPGYLGIPSYIKHRILFYVDFNKTPKDPKDDQRFEGYFFTASRDAMAGITWWSGIPFGFYAIHRSCVPG